MEVRPFNRERELYTANTLLGINGKKHQSYLMVYGEGLLRFNCNEIPIQRDMERNPEERKP